MPNGSMCYKRMQSQHSSACTTCSWSPWGPDTLHELCIPTLVACLASRAVAAPLPVQEGHDRAKRAVQPGQAVAQADVGAHGRPVRVAVQVPYPAVRLPPRAHLDWQAQAL